MMRCAEIHKAKSRKALPSVGDTLPAGYVVLVNKQTLEFGTVRIEMPSHSRGKR